MKPLSSARTAARTLPDGRLELTIEHDVVRGVTPAMPLWWFSHIEEDMEHEGRVLARYLVWHPLDHIAYQVLDRPPDGEVRAGVRFRIVEAFNRDPRYFVDTTDVVEKLDETGIVLAKRLFGRAPVFRLEHRFEGVDGSTLYRSQMLVGSSAPFGRLFFNRLVRPLWFPGHMGRAWLRHNVEEVGNFEHFLPALHARAGGLK
jgi:hypothetical protein